MNRYGDAGVTIREFGFSGAMNTERSMSRYGVPGSKSSNRMNAPISVP